MLQFEDDPRGATTEAIARRNRGDPQDVGGGEVCPLEEIARIGAAARRVRRGPASERSDHLVQEPFPGRAEGRLRRIIGGRRHGARHDLREHHAQVQCFIKGSNVPRPLARVIAEDRRMTFENPSSVPPEPSGRREKPQTP